jgi:putative endonuclease
MKSIGDYYEEQAAQLLVNAGLLIIARNFTRKTGEIDIIARENKHLVFIEVRVRNHPGYAGAAASISARKQTRIIRTAQLYLRANPKWAHMPCRFDVIAFEPRQSVREARVNWIRSAFTA